ncbi:DUF1501 domain-containing protein [Dokdonella sp.]|uniref:DUF1501 domain-containing protein n=1 Tax=Dokdonella sp. TaxID=2291710 RepID=UPI001B092866|nr:DUF1501 domain-containing protein [Dokdonella sp.]MBO9662344.1 DUF1501 domain-containing protein [Dokdonella sp.]
MPTSRRDFLRKSLCAALGGASVYSALGGLRLISAAAAQRPYVFGDYKALVCVFLFGGNDSFNTLAPVSGTERTDYVASRGGIAVPAGELHALTPAAGGGPANYGLHPAMSELAALFNAGKAAVVANVGGLLYPVTQAEYQAGTVPVPPQLFSHSDQSVQWQTSRPDDASANGWGGRVADLLQSSNSGQVPMSVSLGGNNPFQRGAVVQPYAMGTQGVERLSYSDDGPDAWFLEGDNAAGAAAWDALIEPGTQAHLLERAYAGSVRRSIDNYRIIADALGEPPTWTTPFPADNELAAQLQMVARLIGARSALGMHRQVFYVSVGGYDTHAAQLNDHPYLLGQLSQALHAFHAATVQLGVEGGVTTFTASDFGRSLGVNADGTDHGWGGHHFVLGGEVRGQRFYGTLPSLAPNGNPDDTGFGQIIPTTAVDQYSATLARWFGIDAGGITDIFPNLGRFSGADLGFMS